MYFHRDSNQVAVRSRFIRRVGSLAGLGLLLALPAPLPLYAQDTSALAAADATAAASPAAHPIATADAVQEAFVRIAEHMKPSVVTIIAEHKPRATPSVSSTPDATKPGAGKKPGGKPDDKAQSPDTAPDPNDPGDEEDQPFGMPQLGPHDPHERLTSLGTGVVVRADGYILTNYHVVRGANFVRVLFSPDSERPDRVTAKVVGFDEESDLAVLKVQRDNLQAAEFADSDAVRIGEWAIAIGSPFDQAQTVTVGVVSAKGRHLESRARLSLQDYIQTDASINPGNSGGPLIDLEGKVIGINTAILSPSRSNVGIGFSVPSNTIRTYLPLLMGGKSISRGFLGIQYVGLDAKVAQAFGVKGGMQIGALAQGKNGNYIGPAKAAGLQEGDIITAVDGKDINSSDQFRRLVSSATPGTKLALSVMRPTTDPPRQMDVSITLGDFAAQNPSLVRPAATPENVNASRLGLELENADKIGAMERAWIGLEAGTHGAVITDVVPGSAADEAQLQRGMRIVRVRVDGQTWQPVLNKAAFTRIEKGLAPGTHLLMQLRQDKDVSVYKVLIAPTA